jgi:YHS domain-containing protein
LEQLLVTTTAVDPTELSFIDPVCGGDLKGAPADTTRQAEHGGKAYYFCSVECLSRFRATPGDFVTDPLLVE